MTSRQASFLRGAPPPTEHAEQVAFIARCRARAAGDSRAEALAYVFAIGNGAYYGPDARTRAIIGRKMRAEGLAVGFPDVGLLIAVPRGPADPPAPPATPTGWWTAWFGELKRLRGGRIAPEQADWHAELRRRGCRVDVAKGGDALYAALCRYLGLEVDG